MYSKNINIQSFLIAFIANILSACVTSSCSVVFRDFIMSKKTGSHKAKLAFTWRERLHCFAAGETFGRGSVQPRVASGTAMWNA